MPYGALQYSTVVEVQISHNSECVPTRRTTTPTTTTTTFKLLDRDARGEKWDINVECIATTHLDEMHLNA